MNLRPASSLIPEIESLLAAGGLRRNERMHEDRDPAGSKGAGGGRGDDDDAE